MVKAPLTSVKVSDTRTRYSATVTSDPCSDPIGRKRELRALFLAMADQPALFMCGPAIPAKIAIFHDGEAWQFKAEGEDGE